MDQSSQVPELLPCPWCAGPAHLFKGAAGTWVGECPSDECLGYGVYDTPAEAAAAWNNRPTRAAERAAADHRVAEAHARLRELRGAMLGAFDLLITGDGFHDDDRCQARDLLSDALDADDEHKQPRPATEDGLAPSFVPAAEADRRVAEARITALREAAGAICSRCHAEIDVRPDENEHYYHGSRRCPATQIHILIAAEEARNVE